MFFILIIWLKVICFKLYPSYRNLGKVTRSIKKIKNNFEGGYIRPLRVLKEEGYAEGNLFIG